MPIEAETVVLTKAARIVKRMNVADAVEDAAARAND